MSVVYKIDVLSALVTAGFSTYRLRKEKLLPEGTIQHLRNNEPINFSSLGSICKMLDCQPGDLLEYVNEDAV